MKNYKGALLIWILITVIGSTMKIYHMAFADGLLAISIVMTLLGLYLFFSKPGK